MLACADTLAFTPALFSARYRTPRHIVAALAIAAVLTVVLVPVAVVLS